MNTKTETPATIENTVNEISSLRLPSNYGDSLGVKKILSRVSVGRPAKSKFFRVHSDPKMIFETMLLEIKETNESYAVTPQAAQIIGELVKPVRLYAAIDRDNNPFLIPVTLPGESGKSNPWHESLLLGVIAAQNNWVRISANMGNGSYDIYQAQGVIPDPDWGNYTIDKLVEVGFQGRIIKDEDHPTVKLLLGAV